MSKLRTVTVSGADDGVDPKDLAAIAKAFPFVEFAILRSDKLEGTPRYPSRRWRERFVCELYREQFAIHLCGRLSRQAMAGYEHSLSDPSGAPNRVQLNGFSDFVLPGLRLAEMRQSLEFILQCSDAKALERAAELHQRLSNVTALYDASGGRGVAPDGWPKVSGLRMGFAGGLGPNDLTRRLLEQIAEQPPEASPLWIDMESGVRTDDCFDLDKVRRVLELAAPFITKEIP